jgi:hypothetical protein
MPLTKWVRSAARTAKRTLYRAMAYAASVGNPPTEILAGKLGRVQTPCDDALIHTAVC